MKKLSLTALKIAVLGATVYFMVTNLNMNLMDIAKYLLNAQSFFYLALSIFVVFLSVQAWIWVQILNDSERQLSSYRGLVIYMTSQFAKYLPGGFWNLVGRVYLTSKHGVVLGTQMTAILYENMMLGIVSAIYGIILLYTFHFIFLPMLLGLAVLLPLSYYFYEPVRSTTQKLIHKVSKKFRGMELSLPRERFYLYLSYYFLSHLLQGCAFWLLLRTFGVENIGIVTASGIFAVSWLIGLISPLPGGIGIREGALVFLLSFQVPVQVATQISIITRIWNVMGELVLFTLLNSIDLIRKRMTA
ncbi:lysylphosphatidylglycerol synthase transmembrane domain-containing protein [Gorillibacterium sp. sgz5001074]|uniref:lysylphosphatidylglycerol synthase transmembrane domain-containing protein n=1 Tax=Gorillibacterium sp. sgz5001074 TaxID=3446695 RepID=UPI003F6784D5